MVYLVRHGETDWNVQRIIQGKHNDIPLNRKGRRQANKLASYFKTKHIDYIISSPLKRSLQTAEIIARVKNLSIVTREELSEVDYGEWAGVKSNEVSVKFPEQWKKFTANPESFTFPNGESLRAFYERVTKYFKTIPKDKDVLVVTHVNPIRMIIRYILNIKFKSIYNLHIENCTVSGIKYKKSGWEVDFLNCRIQ